MLKMTLVLIAALYVGFVVWGEADAVAEGAPEGTVVLTGDAREFERPTIFGGETAGDEATAVSTTVATTVVPDAATIAAAMPPPPVFEQEGRRDPVTVSLVEADGEPASDTVSTQGGAMFEVTGSRVNMRSGPSTADGVVDSLVRGTLAEVIGVADGGWVEIRDVETGLTGYMASEYLSPA